MFTGAPSHCIAPPAGPYRADGLASRATLPRPQAVRALEKVIRSAVKPHLRAAPTHIAPSKAVPLRPIRDTEKCAPPEPHDAFLEQISSVSLRLWWRRVVNQQYYWQCKQPGRVSRSDRCVNISTYKSGQLLFFRPT